LGKVKDQVLTWVTTGWQVVFDKAGEIGKGLLNGIGDGIKKGWETVSAWFTSTFMPDGSLFTLLWNLSPTGLLLKVGTAIVNGLKGGFDLAWVGGIFGWFQSLGGTIVGAVGDAGKWLVTSGGALIEGLKKGIGDAMSGFGTWIKENVSDKIPQWIKDHLGIKSPSTVMIDIGGNMIAGLEVGVAGTHALQQAMQDLATTMATALGNLPRAMAQPMTDAVQ